MKYQITCDNCGTQFIVEAGEGQVIECQCPHCHGKMEITLPLVSGVDSINNETLEQISNDIQQPIEGEKLNDNRKNVLIGLIIGLLVITLGVGAYYIWL
ncbi:MAG: viral beta C/D like family protein, partial [Prevotella histicola]|nr:viral beta C/D like family protein [Prevotella histicola]